MRNNEGKLECVPPWTETPSGRDPSWTETPLGGRPAKTETPVVGGN